MSLKARYYVKLVAGFAIMQIALVLLGRTGLGHYALPVSFLVSLVFIWLVWPSVLHTAELSQRQRTVMRACHAAILCMAFLFTWMISQG